jgi:hypothetical protein
MTPLQTGGGPPGHGRNNPARKNDFQGRLLFLLTGRRRDQSLSPRAHRNFAERPAN